MKLRQAMKIQSRKHRGCYTPDQLRKSEAVCLRSGWRFWNMHDQKCSEAAGIFVECLTGVAMAARELALSLRLPKCIIHRTS